MLRFYPCKQSINKLWQLVIFLLMRNMKKQVIIIMDGPYYPFGQADQNLSKKPGV